MGDLELFLEHVGRLDRGHDRRWLAGDGWVVPLVVVVILALVVGFTGGMVYAGALDVAELIRESIGP